MTAGAWRTAIAAGVALLAALSAPAAARPARFALFIGNNVGQGHDQPLRFAESDAERMMRLLVRAGGFDAPDTLLLRGRSAADVRAALDQLADRLRHRDADDLVLVYFSGHADAEALHLGRDRLPLVELRATVNNLPAAARVVIVDACQAGSLVRAKGGTPVPVFAVPAGEELPRGLALLASSSAVEMAQESDEAGGSLFTQFLIAGMRGAADRDRNGRVTLVEAFEFASQRTLASTMGSAAGPQHPTFRFDFSGQQDITLTFPGRATGGFARLVFDRPGWYFIRPHGDSGKHDDGAALTELVTRGGDQIALDAGTYEVARRAEDHVEVATIELPTGAARSLAGVSKRQVAFGQAVRKGWASSGRSYGVALTGGTRTALSSLGRPTSATVIGRLDGSLASFELRGGAARSERAGQVASTATWELFAAVAALHAWDFRWPTLAVGGEVGGAGFKQTIGGATRPSWSMAAFVGPLAVLELPVRPWLSLRLELEVPVYLVRELSPGGASRRFEPALRAGAGAGILF